MSTQARASAECLWEELGGDLCICQRPDVSHWCENCQRKIDKIQAFMRGYTETAREAAAQQERAPGWQLAVERIRAVLRKANPGGCRVLSKGDACECPLCDLDNLVFGVDSHPPPTPEGN